MRDNTRDIRGTCPTCAALPTGLIGGATCPTCGGSGAVYARPRPVTRRPSTGPRVVTGPARGAETTAAAYLARQVLPAMIAADPRGGPS